MHVRVLNYYIIIIIIIGVFAKVTIIVRSAAEIN
jgi:F0F1-type ATP synthase assembly protein I